MTARWRYGDLNWAASANPLRQGSWAAVAKTRESLHDEARKSGRPVIVQVRGADSKEEAPHGPCSVDEALQYLVAYLRVQPMEKKWPSGAHVIYAGEPRPLHGGKGPVQAGARVAQLHGKVEGLFAEETELFRCSFDLPDVGLVKGDVPKDDFLVQVADEPRAEDPPALGSSSDASGTPNFAVELLRPEGRARLFGFLESAEEAYKSKKETAEGWHENVAGDTRVIARLRSDGVLEVACRGTVCTANWLTNIQIKLVETSDSFKKNDWPPGSGKVHTGFLAAYASIRDQLHGFLEKHPRAPVEVSGHSLGGALATLAAFDLAVRGRDVTCVTFASPRVGDEDFQAAYRKRLQGKTARFTNKFDPVPRVPFNRKEYAEKSDADLMEFVLHKILHIRQDRLAAGSYLHVCDATEVDVGLYASIEYWGTLASCTYGLYQGFKGGKLDIPKDTVFEVLVPHDLSLYRSNLEDCFTGLEKFDPKRMAQKAWNSRLWANLSPGSGAEGYPSLAPHHAASAFGQLASSAAPWATGLSAVNLGVSVVGLAGTWYGLYLINGKVDEIVVKSDRMLADTATIKNKLDKLEQAMECLGDDFKKQALWEVVRDLKSRQEHLQKEWIFDEEVPKVQFGEFQVQINKLRLELTRLFVGDDGQSPGEVRLMQRYGCPCLNALCESYTVYLHFAEVVHGKPSAQKRAKVAWEEVACFVHWCAWRQMTEVGGLQKALPALAPLMNSLLRLSEQHLSEVSQDRPDFFSDKFSQYPLALQSESIEARVRFALEETQRSAMPTAAKGWFSSAGALAEGTGHEDAVRDYEKIFDACAERACSGGGPRRKTWQEVLVDMSGDAETKEEVLTAVVRASERLGPGEPWLSELRGKAVDVPLQRIKGGDYDEGKDAVAALGQLWPHLAEQRSNVVDRLVLMTKDSSPGVRETAAQALGQLAPHLAERCGDALDALLRLAKDSDWGVRDTAAQALGQLGPHLAGRRDEAVGALQELGKDSDWPVRLFAAEALGKLGPHLAERRGEAVHALQELGKDSHSYVRLAAETVLRGLEQR